MKSRVGIILWAIVVGLGIGAAAAEEGLKVEVIVADYLEPQIRAALEEYIGDLELLGHTVTLTIWGSGDAVALRTHLRDRWQAGELDGATLIGRLPTAWFESEWIMRRGDPAWNGVPFYRAAADFPTDHFFTDLDGEWLDTDRNGRFDVHQDGGGDVTPEIWVGRIWTATLGHEATIVRTYLHRVHRWKMGGLNFREQSLCYVDDDWASGADDIAGEMGRGLANVVTVSDPWTTWRDDWIARITEPGGWTWAHLCSHSWPGGHVFARGDDWSTVYASEIPGIDPEVGFFNFFDCSFARFTEQGYGAGMYVYMTDYGLGGVGSTKTGGMYGSAPFYAVFADGGCLGEAFKAWWSSIGADGYDEGEINWWYGMVVVGDPTLCPNRGMADYASPVGLVDRGWNWVSVPARPLDPAVDAVFGGDVTNRLYRWDAVNKNLELYPDDFGTVEVGRGYTLLADQPVTMSFYGKPAGAEAAVELPRAGWTWIGQPLDEPTPLASLSVWGPGESAIIEDDFNDGDADGWRPWSGNWRVEEGRYVQASNHTLIDSKSTAAPDLADFLVEGVLCIGRRQGSAGFILRGSRFGSGTEEFRGYYVGLDPYQGGVVAERIDSGSVTLATFPHTIVVGRDYVLAVRAEGPRFEVFLDGEKLGEFGDEGFTHGQVGLRTQSVSCEFDDIWVTQAHGTRTALEDCAAADPWVNWNLLYWDAAQRTVKILAMHGGDDDTLRPWRGYRVWSNIDELALVFTRP